MKPVTRAAGGMSYALMKHPQGLLCEVFISHAWAEGQDFVEAKMGGLPSLKLTFSPLKMDGWNRLEYYFPIGFRPIFRGEPLVSGRIKGWMVDLGVAFAQ